MRVEIAWGSLALHRIIRLHILAFFVNRGVNISGKIYGRPRDNIGIGYAYVSGSNTSIGRTQVLEAYTRFVPKRHFAVTLDLQYMNEEFDAGDGPIGWIPGVRLSANF